MSTIQRFNESVAHLDEKQKEALFYDGNCVVTAGAGSGKTTVLSNRFLRLVISQKSHADQILTLTFSRLAASEMFERIQQRLHDFIDSPHIREEIGRLGEATITTIDAFCRQVVSSDPFRYGLPPTLVLDESANEMMAKEVSYQVIDEMSDHPGFQFLTTLYAPDELIDSLFVKMAATQFHPSSQFDAKEQGEKLISSIQNLYEENIAAISSLYATLLSIEGGSGTLFEALIKEASAFKEEEHQALFETHSGEALQFLETLNPIKCRGKKEHVEKCNEIVDLLRETLPLAKGSLYALLNPSHIKDSYEVLERLFVLYVEKKRERGVVSFGDIAHMAHDILLHNSQVRSYFKKKFTHIMIDEFQDTNQLQKEIVYLLAEQYEKCSPSIPLASDLEREKLFLVGDLKQSIYRFRGADVSVFSLITKELVSSGGAIIDLETNYRSEPNLIEFYNTLFEKVMENPSELYEAHYQPLKSRGATEGIDPKIEFLFKPLEEEEEEEEESISAEAEAIAIASLIEKMVNSDHYLIRDKKRGPKRPNYEDIAILFRTTTSQMHYERALRLHGIPYEVSTVQSLFLEAPANDIYLFLQLLLYPDDRLSYAALLRSPFCRLSDETLFAIIKREETPFTPIESWVWGDSEQQKYQRGSEIYAQLKELSKREPISQLIFFLWYEGGYRYYLLSNEKYHPYLEHLDYLIELAHLYDERDNSLSDFLSYIRPLLGQRENLSDIEPLKDYSAGVKLLTIHKSKGLEFPIVILASMGSGSHPLKTPTWYRDDELLSIKHMSPYSVGRESYYTNMVYEKMKGEIEKMESAEMRRLFYVALTRSETHLILVGSQNQKNMGEKAKEKNFLALFFDSFDTTKIVTTTIAPIPSSQLRVASNKKEVLKKVESMRPLYAQYTPRPLFSPSSMSVTALSSTFVKEERDQIEYLPQLDSDPIIEERELWAPFGSWCHSVLEYSIANNGGLLISDSQIQRLIPSQIEQENLSMSSLSLIVEDVKQLAQNFLLSSLFNSLKEREPLSIETEVSFAMKVEEVVVHGSIDLLFLFKDSAMVVDFKSDAIKEPQNHHHQLELYKRAATLLYGKKVETTLFYLRENL